MSRVVVVAAFLLASTASGAPAQRTRSEPPAAPARGAATAAPQHAFGADYLAERYGISREDASNRIRLQQEIAELVSQLKRGDDPDFAGIWIAHEPVFRIYIAYTDPSDRKLLQLRIDPKIRQFVKLVKRDKSRKQAQSEAEAIVQAVRGAGVQDFAASVEEDSGDVTLEVPTAADRDKAVQAIGGPKPHIKIVVKPIAKPTAPPVGVQPGDYIEGGHYYWQTPYLTGMTEAQKEAAKGCTFAFQATFGGKLGILTAGHCRPGPDGSGYWHAINGHWVELPVPTIARWADGTKYDFQFHEITGYSRSNWVYYFNQASVVGLPQTGWVQATSKVGYYGQTKGMVACKSGRVTGITCGQITSGNYYYNGAWGWIRVYRASGQFLGQSGDSGGAVFSDATKGQQVAAYGILTAAQPIGGGASEMVYTPIDYMEDYGVALVLTP